MRSGCEACLCLSLAPLSLPLTARIWHLLVIARLPSHLKWHPGYGKEAPNLKCKTRLDLLQLKCRLSTSWPPLLCCSDERAIWRLRGAIELWPCEGRKEKQGRVKYSRCSPIVSWALGCHKCVTWTRSHSLLLSYMDWECCSTCGSQEVPACKSYSKGVALDSSPDSLLCPI